MLALACSFATGYLGGMLFEYYYHWKMHKVPLQFHIEHHHDFFHLPNAEVASNARSLKSDFYNAGKLYLMLSPLMLVLGYVPVTLIWAGAFVHLVIVYECSHSLLHDDSYLPRFVRALTLYRWWKGCHYMHHRSHPTGNYSVTFPVLDWYMGTYVHPDLDQLPDGFGRTPASAPDA